MYVCVQVSPAYPSLGGENFLHFSPKTVHISAKMSCLYDDVYTGQYFPGISFISHEVSFFSVSVPLVPSLVVSQAVF